MILWLLFAFTQALAAPQLIEVDLASFCEEEATQATTPLPCQTAPTNTDGLASLTQLMTQMGVSDSPVQDKKMTCQMIREMAQNQTAPIELLKKSDDGDEWLFRFHFGFSRTNYMPTDMKLQSSRLDVVIRDFEFKERTSAEYYNPKNWQSFQDGFRWIDEPTNVFAISAEKNNNVFYLNVFHPKFLKVNYQDKHVTGTVDGVAVDGVMPINEPFDGYNNQPGQMHLTRFENTHKQMDWQIGYGRKFVIMDSKRAGQLTYTPQVYAGLSSGMPTAVYVKEGEYWDFDHSGDKHQLQGMNAAVGHSLEYKYGKVAVFAAQKLTVSHLKQDFFDGTAEFNMMYVNPLTVGVTVDLFKLKKKTPQPFQN